MIVSRDQLLMKNYINQGILASLEEVTPDLFKEDVLIKNVVDTTRVDGVCYYLPRTFDIRGEKTRTDLLPYGSEFETLEEYFAFILENDPTYFKIRTPRDIFTTYAQNLDEWIDWENKTARFDTGTFEALLEFCANGGSADEIATYTSQPFTMDSSNFVLEDIIGSYDCPDYATQRYQNSVSWQVDIKNNLWTCYPIPSTIYDGYEIYTSYFIAAIDDDKSLDAARDFLEFHFLQNVVEEYPAGDSEFYMEGLSLGFSINQAECDRYLSRFHPYWEADEVEFLYDRTWDYIHQGDHFQYFRNEIFDAIYEEAGKFFSGSITAKQAADYVQNRISIYLAEQG